MNDLDEFEIFCLYHLGLQGTQAGTPLNLNQVAARLNCAPETVQKFLVERRLDAEHLLNSGFDLVGAQMDVQHAPDGIDLKLAARHHFEQYRALVACE